MNIPLIKLTQEGLSKRTLIKFLFQIELEKYNLKNKPVNFSDRELNILTELYMRGGVSDSPSMLKFIEDCHLLGFTKVVSPQSVRNVLTLAREIKFLRRRTSNNWQVEIIPYTDSPHLMINCILSTHAEDL